MSGFDYGAYFSPIEPLADATRDSDDRIWGNGTEKDKTAHDYVLYLGCNVLRTVALAETITAILTEMGVDFVALGGPSTCCGIIHKSGGDMDVSEKITTQTLAKFEGYDPKAVLTYCPSCHAHMDYTFAETGISMNAPYLHVTEFIVDNLDRLKFKNRVERRVMFHAHGDNEQAERDSHFARAILGAIPGLEVIDASGAPEWGHDCGNLQIGLVGPEKHAALVTNLFQAAKRERVDAVTALYHSCYRNLCPQEDIHGVEVIHYTDLIAEALGLKRREEAFKRLQQQADPDAAYAELSPAAQRRGLSDAKLKKTLGVHFGGSR
jgi:Fe-S oxidoreductase